MSRQSFPATGSGELLRVRAVQASMVGLQPGPVLGLNRYSDDLERLVLILGRAVQLRTSVMKSITLGSW